jgi:hypothetical protein
MVRPGDGTPRAAARSANVMRARARTRGQRPALRTASSTRTASACFTAALTGMGRANSTRSPVCSRWMRQAVWVRMPAATSVGGHSRRISRVAHRARHRRRPRGQRPSRRRRPARVHRGRGRPSHPRPGVRRRERRTSRPVRGGWVGGNAGADEQRNVRVSSQWALFGVDHASAGEAADVIAVAPADPVARRLRPKRRWSSAGRADRRPRHSRRAYAGRSVRRAGGAPGGSTGAAQGFQDHAHRERQGSTRS